MSATIIAFPFHQVLPRAVLETTIQRLIDLLDARDQSHADLEPDEDCESADWDDEFVAAEWHTRSMVAVRRTSHAKAADRICKTRPDESEHDMLPYVGFRPPQGKVRQTCSLTLHSTLRPRSGRSAGTVVQID